MDVDKVIGITEKMLLVDEGCKLFPYRDTRGILSIGIGRNLEDKGISKLEAQYLFQNDITDSIRQCRDQIPCFENLDIIRQCILVDMCFNLGIRGLLGFKKMLAAIEAEDYRQAAEEMIDSRWHRQVGLRALRLEKMMRYGKMDRDYSI